MNKAYNLIGLALALHAPATYAASVCFDEQYYPTVLKLIALEKGFQAELGGRFVTADGKNTVVLHWDDASGWVKPTTKACPYHCRKTNAHTSQCEITIVPWEPLPADRRACRANEDCRGGAPSIYLGPGEPPAEIIEEKPSTCVVDRDAVWFGINFYRGEGYSGYGGIGRFNRLTKKTEIHRPQVLVHVPIHKVISDGTYLWAATTTNYECIGHPPALGLVRYDWKNKQLTQFDGRNEGPCGLVIHDLFWRDEALWVATELGLSRWQRSTNQWSHYFPTTQDFRGVSQLGCADIYKNMRDSLPRDHLPFDSPLSYAQEFDQYLKKHRPWFFETRQ